MIIVLTLPDFVVDEAVRIAAFLSSGRADLVHIRKPCAGKNEVEALIRAIPAEWHNRLVLHDWFELAADYGLYGVHLNRRNPKAPAGWSGSVSRSCHSFEELAACRKDPYNYLSLSPIFDSISKQNYRAAFTMAELEQARRQGLIDHRVLALGGVRFEDVPRVLAMGFGGAMILGDAWK